MPGYLDLKALAVGDFESRRFHATKVWNNAPSSQRGYDGTDEMLHANPIHEPLLSAYAAETVTDFRPGLGPDSAPTDCET